MINKRKIAGHKKLAWTQEETDIAVSMRKEGHTMAVIANKLGRTRNSVISRINKLGLSNNKTAPKTPNMQKKRKTMSYQRSGVTAPVKQGAYQSLAELKPKQCRYPHGDPTEKDFSFCGDDTIKGRPYCLDHYQLCYTRPKKLTEKRVVNDMGREFTKDGAWK